MPRRYCSSSYSTTAPDPCRATATGCNRLSGTSSRMPSSSPRTAGASSFESSPRTAGLGLGLAIVRHLVELHGGTVEAQSPGEGQGATFIVKLPLLRERYATADAASLGGSAPSAFDLPSLAGVDVLLVDDETDPREPSA